MIPSYACFRGSGGPFADGDARIRVINLMITAAEWEAFLDDLQQTLDKFAVPQAEQAEIKVIIDSTRAEIVV